LSRVSRVGAGLGLVLAMVVNSAPARAQECGVPDVDSTYPPDAAPVVPPNAILSAHYSVPAVYDGEPVTLVSSLGDTPAINVTYDEAEVLLRAVPLSPLPAGKYTATFPALRGASSGPGLGRQISFVVAGPFDEAPPTFAGVRSVTWDLSSETDPCTDTLEDRLYFDFELGAATDDAATSLLAVLVFETEHPGSSSSTPPQQIDIQPLPANGKLRVFRPASSAGKRCFAAVTRDLVGFVSGGGNAEVCEETIEPPWFEGCSVSRTRSASTAGWLLFIAFLALGRRARA